MEELNEEMEFLPKSDDKKKKSIFKNKKIWIIIGVILVAIIVVVAIIIHNDKVKEEEQERYNNLPIKVDISMTTYYGTIEYILYELDLDFDLVTMGANCYTGVQRNEFKTEKYGILYTEFRYCKSNKTTIFRVYNDAKDQELREPNPGEIPEFDKYGEKVSSKSSSL